MDIGWKRPILLALLACGMAACCRGAAGEADPRRDAVVDAVARAMPSVVNIATEELVEVSDPFEEMLREYWSPYYRRRERQPEYSLGSGVIIDEAGYVLTNDHVVRRANKIWIKLTDEGGGKVYEAERVSGTTRADIALLRLLVKPGEKFRAVRFAGDDDLLLGETVLALGNPFGLGGSVSRGILSSKSRRPPVENEPLEVADWLQTDAAINPGNSGGPLINLRGELIGLSVAMYRGGQGIGFAVPIKRVTEALSEIFSAELKQLWLGARIRPGGTGLLVSAVDSGSPAERAGLKAGDAVVGINGKTPRGYIDFIQELSASGDKRDVAMVLKRGNNNINASVRLVRESTIFNAALVKQKLGLSLQDITPELADRLGLPTVQGLLVAGVDKDSEAESSGLAKGHIVLALDGVVPDNLVAAAKTLYAKKKGEKIALVILARGRRGRFPVIERAVVELKIR